MEHGGQAPPNNSKRRSGIGVPQSGAPPCRSGTSRRRQPTKKWKTFSRGEHSQGMQGREKPDPIAVHLKGETIVQCRKSNIQCRSQKTGERKTGGPKPPTTGGQEAWSQSCMGGGRGHKLFVTGRP
jgi:hypothetical protein